MLLVFYLQESYLLGDQKIIVRKVMEEDNCNVLRYYGKVEMSWLIRLHDKTAKIRRSATFTRQKSQFNLWLMKETTNPPRNTKVFD